MLITESGKSELLGGRREANGGGGRNANMRNGNAARNGGGGGHVNGKSPAPALPSKRNAANGKAANNGPLHAENRVSSASREDSTYDEAMSRESVSAAYLNYSSRSSVYLAKKTRCCFSSLTKFQPNLLLFLYLERSYSLNFAGW